MQKDQHLEKLKKLLELANFGITKDEFLRDFKDEFLNSLKTVINHILKVETKLIEKLDLSIQEIKDNQDNQTRIEKKDFDEMLVKYEKTIDELLETQRSGMNFIYDKVQNLESGRDGKDGQPGKDADENKIIAEVLNKIKLPEIEIENIKGLKEWLERLETMRRLGGGGGFSYIAMQQHFINNETPSGTVNGVNTDFILNFTPNPIDSLKVYVNGMKMSLTEDYTFSGKTITFLTAPPTGSIVRVDYMK